MIEQIDRLEAENERWIAMLLEDDSGEESGLEAMRGARTDNATKAAQRFAADLGVVGQRVEPCLNGIRRPQACHETTLLRRERKCRRNDRVSAWERARR